MDDRLLTRSSVLTPRGTPGAAYPGTAAPVRGTPRYRRREAWTSLLYVAPTIVCSGLVLYLAIAYTGYLSLFDWNGISLEKTFIGLGNYVQVVHDPVFYTALENTLIFTVLAVFIQAGLGLLMALMLQTRGVRLQGMYRAAFFLPVVLTPTIVATVFRHIFDATQGELDATLQAVGLGSLAQAWLSDPSTVLYAITAINIWQWTGFSFVMYAAGLTAINPSVIEAARIDGAGPWRLLRSIYVPLLRRSHYTLIGLGIIGALKTFDIVWLTSSGGPVHASEFVSTYIYKSTVLNYQAGYASALSVVLLFLALVITVLQLRAYRRSSTW